jgi:hypothetical protein
MSKTQPQCGPGSISTILVLLLTICLNQAQTPSQSPPSRQSKVETETKSAAEPSPLPDKTVDKVKPKKPKRGEIVIAPIPISSPAVGSGLVLVLCYVFKLDQEDQKSPPSTVGIVGARTNNGSSGAGIGGRLYYRENKYQTTFAFARGRANFDFFGIGKIPGNDPISLPLQVGGDVFFGEFMRNVVKDIFIGGRYQYRDLHASLNLRRSGGFEIPQIDIKAKSVASEYMFKEIDATALSIPRKVHCLTLWATSLIRPGVAGVSIKPTRFLTTVIVPLVRNKSSRIAELFVQQIRVCRSTTFVFMGSIVICAATREASFKIAGCLLRRRSTAASCQRDLGLLPSAVSVVSREGGARFAQTRCYLRLESD